MDLTPDLEAKFIEQEHRVVRVVQNYFDRTQWPEGDPRRIAARNAVIWRILAPGTAAVAAGGLIALGTLIVLIWQTKLIAEQNEFFKEQNQKLQTQIDLQGDQDTSRRRTEIFGVLYETQIGSEGTPEPKFNARTRGEAVAEFVQLERLRLNKLKDRVPNYQSGLSLAQARLDGLNLINLDLHDLTLVGAFLENTSFANSNLQKSDLRAARVENTSFPQADLREANFEGTFLNQAIFAQSDLRGAIFISAQLDGCEFLGADLRGAVLTGIRKWENFTNFKFANIANVKGLAPEAREHFIKQGAVEIPSDEQWLEYKRNVFRSP